MPGRDILGQPAWGSDSNDKVWGEAIGVTGDVKWGTNSSEAREGQKWGGSKM